MNWLRSELCQARHVDALAVAPIYYKIASFSAKQIRLVRNPYFHEWSPAQPDGYPDDIIERFGYRDDVAAARAVQHGEADLTGFDNTVPAAVISDLSSQFARQLHENPSLATGFINLNTRVAPFNDVRVRRAVNYAVDRNHWVALRSAHFFQPSCQVLPPGVPGYKRYCPYTIHRTADGKYHGPDPATAQKLVAASGTRGARVTVSVTPMGYCAPCLNYFISVLKRLGYKAGLEVNAALYNRGGDSRARVQAIGNVYFADFRLASTFLLPFLSCSSFKPATTSNPNLSEFCNHHIDRLMARAQAAQLTDPQAAATLWSRADHDIVDQAPYFVIFNFKDFEFTSARTRNYVFSSFTGTLVDQLWVK